jgi:primosomal protein N' (replication factor Y)
LPPYTYLTLFRAEANESEHVEQFLQQVRGIFESSPLCCRETPVMGPNPAPLSRRAGRYRWQLLLQTPDRKTLQQMLTIAKPAIQLLPLARKVRWSIDVEPQDLT